MHKRQQASKHDNIINTLKNIAAASIPRVVWIAYITKTRFNKDKKKGKKQKQNTRFTNNYYSTTTNYIY